jgi:hypothetical protein
MRTYPGDIFTPQWRRRAPGVAVVNPDELVEALLLLREVEDGGLGRFLFERQGHAFVPAVLLWMAGLDALDILYSPVISACAARSRE